MEANATIANELSSEENTILENVLSLLQQLMSMQGGAEATEAPAAVAEAEDMPDVEDEKDVEKAADGETGMSDADERLDEQTEITDASLSDVGKTLKALMAKIQGSKTVTKSQPVKKKDPYLEPLTMIAKSIKTVIDRQNIQEETMANMFKAIGFTDDVINKNLETEKPKDKPIQNQNPQQIAKEIIAEVFKSAPGMIKNEDAVSPMANNFQNREKVSKSQRNILNHIHYNK
jgi:hypothetical protein